MKVNLSGKPGESEGPEGSVCLGEGTLWKTPSKGRANLFHYTIVKGDGSYPTCTCEGYNYRGRCKHTESLWVIEHMGPPEQE